MLLSNASANQHVSTSTIGQKRNLNLNRQERNNGTETEEWCFLFGQLQNVIIVKCQLVQMRERRQFGNPEKGERPPLEAVTRGLVTTKKAENVFFCGEI
jgi:hypothetical protein